MTQMVLELPRFLSDLPTSERELLLRTSLREAARVRVEQLRADYAEAEEKVKVFEARYGMSLTSFEAAGLPGLNTLQQHEDYNDWFYWASVLAEKQRLLASLRHEDLI